MAESWQERTAASGPGMSEQEIEASIASAAVPSLLMLVYQFTGDERWLDDRYRPSKFRGVTPRLDGGLAEDVQAEIRAAAVPVIAALMRGEKPAIDLADPRAMQRAASVFVGQEVEERDAAIMADELQRRAARHDEFFESPIAKAPPGKTAIVIGSGVSGLAAIRMLQQLDIDFTVLERGNEAGGVWQQNRYPGAGVDTPSHLYSFSFHPRDWTMHYALQSELHTYFNDVLDGLGARDRVRFGTEVLSAVYDDDTAQWMVTVRGADGGLETLVADFVISGVGSLNQPVIPALPGRENFQGTQFHTSEWDGSLDLTGKRVAIVGVGASSQQTSPEIAAAVDHLYVVQRSPQWVAPFAQFREQIDDGERLLLDRVPLYSAWYWVGLFWQHGDKIISALRIDPDWEHPDRAINARNDRQRAFLTDYIHQQLEGRPDLIEKVVPTYPPFGKRMLLDNGWYTMLKRDNVSLVADRVVAVDPDGVVLSSGEKLEVDVIIWSTGFAASRFLSSLEVRGAEGVRLSEYWDDDDPRALYGVSIPHFPNFFMIGGPHSLPGSGSFMYFTELQARYLRDLLATMFDQGISALAATEESTQQYNALVDEVHSRTVWSHPGFTTYYRNSKGRVIFVEPFLNVEFWEMVRSPDLNDYEVHEDQEVRRGALSA